MSTTIFAIRSADGSLELALCPAAIELRLSPAAAAEFDAACAAMKSGGWLPLWRQIKSALVSAAQFMSHKFVDLLERFPLEAVTEVACVDGRLEVRTAAGNQLRGELKIELGAYKLVHNYDEPGLFAAADVAAFAARLGEVKPLYEAYLARLGA
jgi:hypothetical protein